MSFLFSMTDGYNTLRGGLSVVDNCTLDNYSLIKSMSNFSCVTAKDDGTQLLSVSIRSNDQHSVLWVKGLQLNLHDVDESSLPPPRSSAGQSDVIQVDVFTYVIIFLLYDVVYCIRKMKWAMKCHSSLKLHQIEREIRKRLWRRHRWWWVNLQHPLRSDHLNQEIKASWGGHARADDFLRLLLKVLPCLLQLPQRQCEVSLIAGLTVDPDHP